jgi:hypothetical protein
MTDPISQTVEALVAIVPNRPGDSPNAPLARRLEVLIGAAEAIARAFPDNGELGEAQGLDLTVQARTLAHVVDTRTRLCLPEGYNLPRYSETALEASGND